MSGDDRKGPRLSARGQADLAARQVREAAALRENLRKRAAQRRARRTGTPESPAPAGGPGKQRDGVA